MSNIVQLPRLHRTQGPSVPANPRASRVTRFLRGYGLSPGKCVSLILGLLIGLPLLYLALCAMLVA